MKVCLSEALNSDRDAMDAGDSRIGLLAPVPVPLVPIAVPLGCGTTLRALMRAAEPRYDAILSGDCARLIDSARCIGLLGQTGLRGAVSAPGLHTKRSHEAALNVVPGRSMNRCDFCGVGQRSGAREGRSWRERHGGQGGSPLQGVRKLQCFSLGAEKASSHLVCQNRDT